MVSEPEEPFCDLRFSKLGFKTLGLCKLHFNTKMWLLAWFSSPKKKQNNILFWKKQNGRVVCLANPSQHIAFHNQKRPLTVRIKKRKTDLIQTRFRTPFFAPEQQHTIYVQLSLNNLPFLNWKKSFSGRQSKWQENASATILFQWFCINIIDFQIFFNCFSSFFTIFLFSNLGGPRERPHPRSQVKLSLQRAEVQLRAFPQTDTAIKKNTNFVCRGRQKRVPDLATP